MGYAGDPIRVAPSYSAFLSWPFYVQGHLMQGHESRRRALGYLIFLRLLGRGNVECELGRRSRLASLTGSGIISAHLSREIGVSTPQGSETVASGDVV